MDRFELMQAFVRAVETGSLTAAAKELGTTQPTVSKWLSALERSVGARLLLRNTQGLKLTDAGERYFDASKRVLGDLERAEADARGLKDEVRGTLRINAVVGLGEQLVCPIVLDFQSKHPGLDVQLVCSDSIVDLVGDRVDVAIRMGTVGNESLVARPLGGARYVLVASPAYLKKHRAPKAPEQLSQHNYLFYGGNWQERLQTPSGPVIVTVHNDFQANSVRAVRLAAVLGHGIARAKRWLVHEDLEAGRLVEVLPGVAPAPEPTYAVYLAVPHQPAKVKAFVAHLQQEISSVPGWVPPEQVPPYAPDGKPPWPTGDVFPPG
jgi:DNA-binding transcriptional LysR family regulator